MFNLNRLIGQNFHFQALRRVCPSNSSVAVQIHTISQLHGKKNYDFALKSMNNRRHGPPPGEGRLPGNKLSRPIFQNVLFEEGRVKPRRCSAHKPSWYLAPQPSQAAVNINSSLHSAFSSLRLCSFCTFGYHVGILPFAVVFQCPCCYLPPRPPQGVSEFYFFGTLLAFMTASSQTSARTSCT